MQKPKIPDLTLRINFTIFTHLNNENLNDHEKKTPHLHSSASSDSNVEIEWSLLLFRCSQHLTRHLICHYTLFYLCLLLLFIERFPLVGIDSFFSSWNLFVYTLRFSFHLLRLQTLSVSYQLFLIFLSQCQRLHLIYFLCCLQMIESFDVCYLSLSDGVKHFYFIIINFFQNCLQFLQLQNILEP